MRSANGRLVIAFDGEIYDKGDLRQDLDALGVAWRGSSDAEVLLEAIAAWGAEAILERIEGQFALALWDRPRGQLLLARDRFGQKPLYYGMMGPDFVFTSELKGLRPHPQFSGEIDCEALAAYLRYGYVPHPWSIYRGVRKLPQASVLRVQGCDPGQAPLVPKAYWDLQAAARRAAAEPFRGSEADAIETLDDVLQRSIATRTAADAPTGGLISGGVETSLTVALMQAASSRPVKTFAVGSWDRRLNQAEQASAMATALGTDHTEFYVGGETALAEIPKLGDICDEPFADPTQVLTYLALRMASESVPVVLSGDGGDELFGGHDRYFQDARWRRFAKLPRPLRSMALGAVESISARSWNKAFGGLGPLAPKALRHGRAGDRLHQWAYNARARTERAFLGKQLSSWLEPAAVAAFPVETADLTSALALQTHGFSLGAMYGDTEYYLPDDVLVRAERASAAANLRVRTCFLDRTVFDFAWRLPLEMKIHEGQGKHILHRLLARHLTKATKGLSERPMQAVAAPIADWLRTELRDWAEGLLDVRRLREDGLLNPEVVRRTWDEHSSGQRNWTKQLWAILMLQMWLDEQGAAIGSEPGRLLAAS
jgi:asparagine synthase (glutamine-hydrolysing)